jgi:hypothetical protein
MMNFLDPGGEPRAVASLALAQEFSHGGQGDGAGDHLDCEAAAGQMTGQRGQLDCGYDRAAPASAGPVWLAQTGWSGVRRAGILPGSSLKRHVDLTIWAATGYRLAGFPACPAR